MKLKICSLLLITANAYAMHENTTNPQPLCEKAQAVLNKGRNRVRSTFANLVKACSLTINDVKKYQDSVQEKQSQGPRQITVDSSIQSGWSSVIANYAEKLGLKGTLHVRTQNESTCPVMVDYDKDLGNSLIFSQDALTLSEVYKNWVDISTVLPEFDDLEHFLDTMYPDKPDAKELVLNNVEFFHTIDEILQTSIPVELMRIKNHDCLKHDVLNTLITSKKSFTGLTQQQIDACNKFQEAQLLKAELDTIAALPQYACAIIQGAQKELDIARIKTPGDTEYLRATAERIALADKLRALIS